MDEEVVMLFKRLGLAFLVAIIFAIPTAIFVYNKYDNSTGEIIDKMKNDRALLFITGYKCDECKTIKKILKDNNISYFEINKDIDHQNYKIIINRINLPEEFAPAPSLILVENGELSVNINDFNSVNLDEFFKEYNLI